MKYEVGDKVTIKKDLKNGRNGAKCPSGRQRFVDMSMAELHGQIATIISVHSDRYEIDLDYRGSWWDDEMFESEYDDLKSGKITWKKYFEK